MATETTKIPYVEGAAASTPAANRVVTYAKADGLMYSKDDAGTETLMSAGAAATRASLGLATSDSPEFAGVNVGAATDTTITRTGAGEIAVEGNRIFRVGGADVPIADGGTGASTATLGFDALSPMTTAGDLIVGGVSGTRTRLAKGSDSQVLTVDPSTHLLVWATPSSGFSDPMTTRGDIIVRNAANATARLAVGTSTYVLTSDGTDAAWAAPSGGSGALVLLEQHTASSSATLDFTTFISGTYDDYEFRVSDLVAATNGSSLRLQVGTGGGPSWDATSGRYLWGRFYRDTSGGAGAGSVSDTALSLMILVSSTGPTQLTGRLINPSGTTYGKVFDWQGSQFASDTNIYGNTGFGRYNQTTALTGLRFLMSAGNIASGIIRVYGVTK